MTDTQHVPHPRIAERAKERLHLITKEKQGLSSRIAVFVTAKFGTMSTFYVLAIWMFAWIILATTGVGFFKQDPYPFTFLLFLSNLVQLFALPILAVGQQILSHSSEKQAEQTYKDAEAILKLQDEVYRLTKMNNAMIEEMHSSVKSRHD